MKSRISISREQFFNFIKNKKDTDTKVSSFNQHYLNYFDKYQTTNKKGNWNWGGLVPVWFFYRRMYLNGLAVIGFDRFLSRFGDWLDQRLSSNLPGDIIIPCLDLIILIMLMRYSDYFYLLHANQKISKGILKSGTNMPLLLALYFSIILMFVVGYLAYITRNPF